MNCTPRCPRFLSFAITGLLLAACGSGARRGQPSFSLPAEAAAPMAVLSLGGTLTAAQDGVAVRFTDDAGNSVAVPALAGSPLKVGVPPWFDPATGDPVTRTVALTVVLGDGREFVIPGRLAIQALPVVELAPGTLAEAFLEGTLRALDSAGADLRAVADDPVLGAFVQPELFASIDASRMRVTRMRAAVREALGRPAPPPSWARARAADGPVLATLEAKSLAIADRVIAGLLQQLLPDSPGGPGSLSMEDIARDWMVTFDDQVAGEWLGWGEKVGQVVGLTAAVGGLGLTLVAATPTAAAVGTTLAIVGGVGFLAATFVPATSAAYLKLGARTLLDLPASAETVLPELQYVAKNTIGTGVATLAGMQIEEIAGEVSAAVFDVVNSAVDLVGRVGAFFGAAAGHVLALGPVGRGQNRTGSYAGVLQGQGTFVRTFPETTCTWAGTFRGNVWADLVVYTDGSVTGSVRVTGTFDSRTLSGSTRTFTCRPGTDPFDSVAPITGTTSDIRWTSDLLGGVFPARFEGRLQGSSVVGRMAISYTLGSGSVSSSLSLAKR